MMREEELVPKRRFSEFNAEWKGYSLGEVSNIIGGGTPSTSVKEFWDGKIDWYSPVEIGNNIYVNNSQRKISKLGFEKSSTNLLPVGTILFTSRAGIGKTAILQKEGTTNQGFQSIVPMKNVLDTYFLYSRSKELKTFGEKNASGSTFLEISGKQMEKMNMYLPEVEEQQKIGQFFKHLDEMITLEQRKIDKTKALKSAYLAEMFPAEGESVPKRRFAGFKGDWKKQKLDDIAVEILAGGDIDRSKISDKGRYPVLANALTNNGIVGYYQNEFRVKAPAVTITGRGEVGHAQVRTTNFTPVVRLLSIKTNHDVYFLEHSINNYKGTSESTGVPQLTVPKLRNYKIHFPNSIEEEALIGGFFKHLDDIIKTHQQKTNKLKATKQAYLNEMFV